VKTALKDAREYRRARSFRVDPDGPWRDHELAFVWQRHELFQVAGYQLASRYASRRPCFVPATLVWQAGVWGVHRPGWARMLERVGERGPLRRADVVACGTDAVVDEVVRSASTPRGSW